MSKYYNPKRTRNIYSPGSDKPFKLSRSKLELFINCPRCFYIDRRLGVGQPPSYPFTLNSAVDALLKKEFDIYRAKKIPHPLIVENNIYAVPYQHPEIETWRDSLRAGIQVEVEGTNLIVTGGVDDIWQDMNSKELIVVDYKATAKSQEVTIDADWQASYKRQIEIYQWLLRENGFEVSNASYFVYCNGKLDAEKFNNTLEFDVKLIPYEGDSEWVGGAIKDAYSCLVSDTCPERSKDCDYCKYINALLEVLKQDN